MRIDAHQHYWVIGAPEQAWPTTSLPSIHRNFLPQDLTVDLAEANIARTVLVQSQPNDSDTDWLLDLAETTASVGGVVGWVDVRAPAAVQRIAALVARSGKLKGLRPMLQDLPSGWILDPEARPALAAMDAHGLVFDALIRPIHLADVTALAMEYPTLQIVFDHIGKPDIAGDMREPWARDLVRTATCPNVWCKLFGLVTEAAAGWQSANLAWYVDHVVATFGPDRLLWGSDWPVSLLASDAGWLATADQLLGGFDDATRSAMFGGTAARLYGISA
jgi:L-fuconolactonase